LLWVHAPSVGEGLQANAVLQRLRPAHPTWQIVYSFFSPSAEEIDWARRVIEAFAGAPGMGAIAMDGRMIDRPHVKQAERILAAARR
jgi:citrate lyase subunit beta/citryl-CoA lyase